MKQTSSFNFNTILITFPLKESNSHIFHKLEAFNFADTWKNVTALHKESPNLEHLTKHREIICDT